MVEVSNVRRLSTVSKLPVANGAHIVALDPFAPAPDAVSRDNSSKRRPSNVGSTLGSESLKADRLALLGEPRKDENMRRMSSCSNISDRSNPRLGAVRSSALSIRGALQSPMPGSDRETLKSPVPPQDHLEGNPGARLSVSTGGGRKLSSVGRRSSFMGTQSQSQSQSQSSEFMPRSSTSSPSPWTTNASGANLNRRPTLNTVAGRNVGLKRHSPCIVPSILPQEVHDSSPSHRGTLLLVPGSEYSTAANTPRGSTYETASSRSSVQSHASVQGLMSQYASRYASTRSTLLEKLDENETNEGKPQHLNLQGVQVEAGGQQQQQHSRLDEVRVTTFTFSQELTERLAKSKAKKARNRALRTKGMSGVVAIEDALETAFQAAEKAAEKGGGKSSAENSPPSSTGGSKPWTRRATLFSSNLSRCTDESENYIADEERSDPEAEKEGKDEVYDINDGEEEEAEDDEDPQVERGMRGSPQDVMRKSVWTRPRDMGKLQAVYKSTKEQLARAKEEDPPGRFKAKFQKIAGAVQASFHTVNTAKALVSIFQDLKADASRLNTVVEQDEDFSPKFMPSRKVDWHGKSILTVRIIAAHGLAWFDPFPNPYVMVTLGSTKYCTETASQQADPVWDQMCQNRQFSFMVRPEDHDALQMRVYSEHPNQEDTYLGHVEVSVPSCASAEWITQKSKLIFDAEDLPEADMHVENQSELEFQLKMEDENSFAEVKERPPTKQCRTHPGVDSFAPAEPSSLTPSLQHCQSHQKHTPIEKRIARKKRLEHQRASLHQIIHEKLGMDSSVAPPAPSESTVLNELIPQPSRIVSPVGSSTGAVGSPRHMPTPPALHLLLEDMSKEVDKVIDRMQELTACFEGRLDHVEQIDDAADDVTANANELFTHLHMEPISLQNGRRHRKGNEKAGNVENPPGFWDTEKSDEEYDPFDMLPLAGDEQSEEGRHQQHRPSGGVLLSEEDAGIHFTLDAQGAVALVTEDLMSLTSKRDQEVSMAQADMAEMHMFQAELKELLHALEELLQQELTGLRELISVDLVGDEEDTEVLYGARHNQLSISLKNSKLAQKKLRACTRKADSRQKADSPQKADSRLQFQSSCRRYSPSAGTAFSFKVHAITPIVKQTVHSCKKSPIGSLRQHQQGSPGQHHHVNVNHQSKMSSKQSSHTMNLKRTLQSLKLAAFQEGDVDSADWKSMAWDCPPWELSSALKKGGWPRALASPLQKLATLRKRTTAPSAVSRLQRRMPFGPVVTSESQESLANVVPSGFSTTSSARAGSKNSEGAPRVGLSQLLSAQSSSPSLMSWLADGSASSAGDASTGQLGAQAHMKQGVSGWVFLKPVNVEDDSRPGTGCVSLTPGDPSTWGFSRDTSDSNLYLPPASALNSPGPKHIHMKTAEELDEMEELESLMEQSALYYLSRAKLQRPRTGPAMTSSGLMATSPPPHRKLVTR